MAPAVWNTYFKFCVERNPWDKVISWVLLGAQGRAQAFAGILHHGGPGQGPGRDGRQQPVHHQRRRGGRSHLQVPRICRRRCGYLAARVGLPEIPQLPHAKSGFREDRRPYRDLYGHAEREVVRDIFGGEIAALDYTF